MIHVADAQYNVKARVAVPGAGAVNVPRDCDECGSFWRLDDMDGGARYGDGGRWMCVECWHKREAPVGL